MPEAALQALPDGKQWTLSVLYEPKDATCSPNYVCHLVSMAASSNTNAFILYGDHSIYAAGTPTAGALPAYTPNVVTQVTVVRSGDEFKVYKDGVFAVSYTKAGATSQTAIQGWVLGQDQDSVKGGFDPNQSMSANFYKVSLYSTAFSAEQVLEEYNGSLLDKASCAVLTDNDTNTACE